MEELDVKKLMEDELPDVPALVAAIEESLKEFEDLDDYGSITKRKLAINQQTLFDALHDIATSVVVKDYQIDMLVKGFERVHTMINEILEDEELTDGAREHLSDVNNTFDSSMFS